MCFILTCRVLSHFYVTHDSLVQKGVLGMCTCVTDGETGRERDLSGEPNLTCHAGGRPVAEVRVPGF